jgi:putative DNA primase/helicase
MRDAAGKLWNLQTHCTREADGRRPGKIVFEGRPQRPACGTCCGDVGADPAVRLRGGWCARASQPVASSVLPGHRPPSWLCAFDSGQPGATWSKALRKKYPAALLVLCGDDDRATEARTGSNPGRLKADGGGAMPCGAWRCFPSPCLKGGS